MTERIILHLDMDAFFAAVEERESPHFKGKPVVVGADPLEGKGRGVVSTANYEARKYGIHSALPISTAYRLCPQAVFLPVNGELYNEVSGRIMEILHKHASVVEQVSLDEAYLDISFVGTYRKAEKFGQDIREEIFERERLPASCGVGPNKMIAKIACGRAKPNGILIVEPKDVEKFLEPLDIQEIPGVGPKTAALLYQALQKQELTVADVKKMRKEELIDLLGAYGGDLYDKVRGVDESPVVVDEEVKSIGKEHTFSIDTRDGEEIFLVFRGLVKDVWQEAKEQGISFKGITVRCRFQGFETHTKTKTRKEGIKTEAVFQKEASALLLRFLVENPKPVRLVGIRIGSLSA
ncbi:MAG: DNA polymerase IV [Candidatus Wildermuthbacteria bacterium]|nr:DNA polymerase IV [Candidatus Wildermuthbacteria bacterium]